MHDEDGVRCVCAVAEVMSMMIYVYYYIYIRSEWVIGWRGKDDLGTVDEDEDVDEDDQEEIEGEREARKGEGARGKEDAKLNEEEEKYNTHTKIEWSEVKVLMMMIVWWVDEIDSIQFDLIQSLLESPLLLLY